MKMKMHMVLFVALAAVLALAVQPSAAIDELVQTTLGPVQGVVNSGYGRWLGIPYAADTGMENRFMPPQPRAPWSAPFDASDFGPGCPQTGHTPDVPTWLTEDCLNVNVFAPAAATPSSGFPVMVFIYGGAFVSGSNQGPWDMYDGSHYVTNSDVVVAGCNYRLGSFGYMVAGETVKGNQGILDQRMCLEWVRDNIAAFGGDPNQVTIWGESAGAMSVGIHLVSPGSAGLFNRAIMESNPAGYRYRTAAKNADYGNKACDLMGCKPLFDSCNVTCMQHAPVSVVEAAYSKALKDPVVIGEANWGYWLEAALGCAPSVDGDVLPLTVQDALASGAFNKDVEVLVGTNTNEGTTFVFAFLTSPLSEVEYDALMLGVFGDTLADKIKSYYEAYETEDTRAVLSKIITDMWFRCGSEVFATQIAAEGNAAYVYRFNHPNFSGEFLFELFGVPSECRNKTCHMVELPFVFHKTSISDPAFSMRPSEVTFSDTVSAFWAAFGTTGDVNNAGASTQWPQWNAGRVNMLLESQGLSTEDSVELCEFWDAVGYNH